jgi:formylglycine-generating enzyme
VTDVGAYTGSASSYGTFDQGGNVDEWNEQTFLSTGQGIRGGSWSGGAPNPGASFPNGSSPAAESSNFGFRVASLVPEPEGSLLMLTALAALSGLAASRSPAS